MSEVRDALRYAIPSAIVGGIVWLAVAYASGGEFDFVQGAMFVVAFGVVSALGYHYGRDAE